MTLIYPSGSPLLVSGRVTASQDQATGITQINQAMANLDSATQQNASMAEETASTSEELASQATVLEQLIENLMRLVNGASSTTTNHATGPMTVHNAHTPQKTALKLAHGGNNQPQSFNKKVITTAPKSKSSSLKKVVGADFASEDTSSDDKWNKV